jgi:DNA-binding CsgD family transcriptional regulator
MAATPRSSRERAVPLRGRRAELSVLASLVAAVRAGESRVLVLRGEPGAGKTALLDDLATKAAGCRVVRTAGVQSEIEFAFAGLHQLLAPMLDRLEQLPAPQRDALRTVFGLSAGPAPDRFLVALAVLSLLSQTAEEQPLVCLIDDQHWLDQASAQALGFAARRLAADPVGLVFAARIAGEELAGLPELAIGGLADGDARTLLDSALTGPLDTRVRDQIVAEAGGNPLALLELPRGMTTAELAGGFGLLGALPGQASLTGRIEDSFRRRLDALPDQTRRLLLLAAADPSGDSSLVWRAAGRLGLPVAEAAAPAVEAGLAEFGARIRFRHPLVRSAAYRSASFAERQRVHAVLAEVTDPAADPDRRAWHRAQAADGPDEEVAAELERSAARAQARGGLAAAAAFLERSVRLTVDPARLAERTLAAAQASMQAGAFDQALGLLVMTEARPLGEFASARVDLLRGQVALASGMVTDASPLLLRAARRLEPLNPGLVRETYLDAWTAAFSVGQLAAGDLAEICRAARALPRSPESAPVELLLEGLALLITDGLPAAAPTLRRAVSLFAGDSVSASDRLRWSYLAIWPAIRPWDDEGYRAILARHLQLVRNAGALDRLPIDLRTAGVLAAWSGDFGAAAALIAEVEAICEATGARIAPYATLLLAGLRGNQAEVVPLINATINEAGARTHMVTLTRWMTAILYNGLGRYEEAREEARQAAEDPSGFQISLWALLELIEAAVRSGNLPMAADAVARLAETTQAGGTNLALGLEARSRALVAEDSAAENLYADAIDRLGRTQLRPELARAHLLYGEWLRRENRRTDAREQLRTAHTMLDEIGMEAFAERARRELLATGVTARKRTAPAAAAASQELTPQEAQVARLARDGLSNPEIGARLFISSHTVQYHLGKVFTKLGIASRGQLHQALPADLGVPAPR